MGVRERMIEAAYAAPKAAGVLAVDVEIIAQACADVATEDNGKLLDMNKARGAEVERLTDEVVRLQKEADVHNEWRKAANRRVRELEGQLAEAASAGDDTLSKRERFAKAALQGLLSDGEWCTRASEANTSETNARLAIAVAAVLQADMLLVALDGPITKLEREECGRCGAPGTCPGPGKCGNL